MKYCSRCRVTKPATEFQRNKAQRDGLQNYCKPCRNLIDCEAKPKKAERYANQLAKGIQIKAYAHHHIGMAHLKARLGEPRPVGMTLSLVNWESPHVYHGVDHGKSYRLSTNPDDYFWETQEANNARKVR